MSVQNKPETNPKTEIEDDLQTHVPGRSQYDFQIVEE